MSTDYELLFISPEGESHKAVIYGFPRAEVVLAGKPSGTLMRIAVHRPWADHPQWVERIGPVIRTYPREDIPAHIRTKCLLLGIQP